MESERDGTVEMDLVTRNVTRSKRSRGVDDGERKLEPIDPGIVACIHLEPLQTSSERQGWVWAITALQLLRGVIEPRKRDVPSSEPLPKVHLTRFMHKVWPQLVECGLLKPVHAKFVWAARCGLSEFENSDSLYRVIFDARPANQLLQRVSGPFGLFRAEDLCATVSRWLTWSQHTGKPILAATIEFKHFFYQVPIQ